jgi:hypothetical protein
MNRLLIGLALVGLLAACTTQGDGPTDEPVGSAPIGSAEASGPAVGAASPACEEAFAPLAGMEVASLSDLGDLQAELPPTIESCESVADWIAGAQQVVDDEINPSTAELLLGIQCNDPTLSNTLVCEELAAS